MTLPTVKIGDRGHVDNHNAIAARLNRYPSVMDYAGDDTTKWKAAIAANVGGSIYAPKNTYLITEPITILDNIHIEAEPGAILKAIAPMEYIIGTPSTMVYTRQAIIENLILDANDLATNALYLYCCLERSRIINVQCTKAVGDGLLATRCMVATFENLNCISNGANGMHFVGCNAARLLSSRAVSNVGNGIELDRVDSNYISVMYLFGNDSESNGGHGIYINWITAPYAIFGGWIEGNVKDGIYTVDSLGTIDGLVISVAKGSGSNYAIHMGGTYGGAHISGCRLYDQSIVDGDPPSNYQQVYDEVGICTYGLNWYSWNKRLLYNNRGKAANIADGGTIIHGLRKTPTAAQISGSVAGEIVSVTALGATTFTVAIKKHDGSAGTTQTIYWRAEV